MKNSTSYIPQLDTLRAFAVIGVINWHWLKGGWSFGGTGVILFFVLSGYLITGILLKAKYNSENSISAKIYTLKNFIARRTLRIFPLYFLFISVFILGLKNIQNVQDYWIWYYLYASNILFFLKQGFLSVLLNHTWSLAVEEQFYLFWPLIILFVPRKDELKIILGFILLGPISRIVFSFLNLWDNTLLTTYLDCLAGGGLLAYLQLNPSTMKGFGQLKRFIPYAISILGAFVIYVYYMHQAYFHIVTNMLYALTTCLILYQLTSNYHQKWNFIFRNPALIFLGKISYGLYIYHKVIPWALTWTMSKIGFEMSQNLYINYMLYWIVLIPICYISYHYFEQPFNKLKRHFTYIKLSLKSPIQIQSN
jgi:peptidoglycan/LPS O-acetylase OafA/YrhL